MVLWSTQRLRRPRMRFPPGARHTVRRCCGCERRTRAGDRWHHSGHLEERCRLASRRPALADGTCAIRSPGLRREDRDRLRLVAESLVRMRLTDASAGFARFHRLYFVYVGIDRSAKRGGDPARLPAQLFIELAEMSRFFRG